MPVQLLGVGEQIEQEQHRLAGRIEARGVHVVELPGEPAALVANLPQPGRDLVLWPVGVTDQVEESVLLPVEDGKLVLDPAVQVRAGPGGLGQHLADARGELVSQFAGQHDRRVVVEHRRLDPGDRQVWQVADVLLPPTAEVVEVQVAGVALAPHDHEPAAAAVTPDDAFEVVVVGAFADATGSARGEHLLDAIEDLGSHQRLVPSLIFDLSVRHETEVVPVAEQVAQRVQRDRGAGREPLRGASA